MVASSPHIKDAMTTQKIMLNVIIALTPALIASVIIFGFRALLVTAVCAVSCVMFEYLYRALLKKDNTTSDLSAVVTGMLLAFNLPVTIPIWMAVIGSFVSIVVVKQLFGGIGQNFANPAIVGRIVLFLSFSSAMSTWVEPFYYRSADVVATATPLALLSDPAAAIPSNMELFLGLTGGCLGETCALALLIGGVYLVARRIINPMAPVAFIGTVFVGSFLLGLDPVAQILSGGLMLGAIFMATDYATSPVTFWGKCIFGVGCGLITLLIRNFASYPEGVSFAILLMNILTPYIEKLTRPRVFGGAKA
ncbi:RnfABCDGE type electron transport complex subunit D [Oscillospiraceae bacterium NSJ-54]|uniref:Ion-translocating oxidoreductase complex subunit D n=1 Tax=Zongyangia hominis TaxID=2763677 RepID=A0A926EAC3_9FIRM|nr:RnfABCDGE type electron transport complex subunit D [Zongyangia hominis]MBC8569335.1 RnfABCDGE type electron transport complex subunit D [Zongyangia hominis]